MRIEEKYAELYIKMDENINVRKNNGKMPAMGYTSNLDVLCDFQMDILNHLLEEFMQGEDLRNMKASKVIRTVQDFIRTLVYFCGKGIGGEVEIEDTEIIEKFFATKYGIGGTAAQAAMALAAVGCPSVIHLTDDSKEVCEILDSPRIYTVSADGSLIHTNQVTQKSEQELHYIIQFKKGDMIRLGDQELAIPISNRLIITRITVNEIMPFSKPYFEYIERYAKDISSNVLSSFNALKDKEILQKRLDDVRQHIRKYKANNESGIVFFEDAHYHSDAIRKLCIETIYSEVDMVCMNEEELAYTLSMYNFPIQIDDIISCVEGIKYLKEKFRMSKGIIVHTKDYSLYVGDRLPIDIESGLIYGNMLATAKAMVGWYGSKEEISKVIELPLSEKGVFNKEIIDKSIYAGEAIIVPTKYIDKPRYTIGLGDSFVAGVQICFM
ncbi:ADP-dependent glucokinase/phosphofructokinase [Cohnella sp. REN36]|uniref:ADP-dependent glucokinase/phosphofructokinase n=1 Tax=Cohnella sp. REN36 TaxID=2887347 RepID=UPI001D140653|nr:ADP-dependent glucokinase/phosphofructokinase [Cohnella sp. REN36]MCC3372365.1 ADP-dependent glucokinase/phosphofructokinase [Cohnella sp. REN36]